MGALCATALRTAFDRAESLLRIPVGEEEPVEDEELEDPQCAVRGDVRGLDGDGVPAPGPVRRVGRRDVDGEGGEDEPGERQGDEWDDLADDGPATVMRPDPPAVQLEGRDRADRGGDHVGDRRVDAGYADEDAEGRQARAGRDRGDGTVPEPDGQALASAGRADGGAGGGADEGFGRRHGPTVAGRDQSPLGPR